jgi:cytochrome c-type biogenesis protein
MGYLSRSAALPNGTIVARRDVVSHALAFVLGFTQSSSRSGTPSLRSPSSWFTLAHIASVIVVVFGIHVLGIIGIPLLYREARSQARKANSFSCAFRFSKSTNKAPLLFLTFPCR